MNMLFTASLFLFISCSLSNPVQIPFMQPQKSPDIVFVENLVEQMTFEELALQLDMFQGDLLTSHGQIESDKHFAKLLGKGNIMGVLHDFYAPSDVLNQMQSYALKQSRLKIPILVIEECLHGLLYDNRTVFPRNLNDTRLTIVEAIALAATFNVKRVEEIGQAIAAEARASGIHFCLSPVLGNDPQKLIFWIDLARDPRWGRVEEGYGECPYLTSQMGVAMVHGMQARGELKSNTSVVAEMKHFAAHGSPAGGRNKASVKDGRRELYSQYLVPFREAVVTAGARGVMSAYNEVDGIPNAANHELMTKVLRDTWGFKGIVVADLGAVLMLVKPHAVAKNAADALRQFHEAGGNVQFYDFEHDDYLEAVVEGMKSDDA